LDEFWVEFEAAGLSTMQTNKRQPARTNPKIISLGGLPGRLSKTTDSFSSSRYAELPSSERERWKRNLQWLGRHSFDEIAPTVGPRCI